MIKEKSGLEKILSRIEQERVTVEIDFFDEKNPLHYFAVVRSVEDHITTPGYMLVWMENYGGDSVKIQLEVRLRNML